MKDYITREMEKLQKEIKELSAHNSDISLVWKEGYLNGKLKAFEDMLLYFMDTE